MRRTVERDAYGRSVRRLSGCWRIVEMDVWDREAIDLVGPAFIEFDSKGNGALGFIAVEGVLDARRSMSGDRPRLDFSWEGNDEGHPVSGRGWVELEPDGALRGHIFFHLGDDSAFRAVKDARAR
jgi:hypothetical protein